EVGSEKKGFFWTDCIVQTKAGQMTPRRLLRNVVVTEKERVGKSNLAGPHLVVALIVAKEEKPILFDRPSNGAPVLSPDKEGILKMRASCGSRVTAQWAQRGRVGRTLEARESSDIVIAEEKETAAMKIVGSSAGHDVDCSG